MDIKKVNEVLESVNVDILGELTEATAKDFSAAIRQIARMTNRNDHGKAMLAGAKLLGAKELADRFELVNKLHDIEEHLPKELYDYRYSLFKQLKQLAEKKLSKEDLNKFYSAF